MNFNINTAEVAVNETVFSKSIEQSVDCDITLPDYCGDIGRILKCFVRPNITNSSLNSQRIVIDGTVIVSLMFVSDGKIQCYEYSSPFSANIDFNCDSSEIIIKKTEDAHNGRSLVGKPGCDLRPQQSESHAKRQKQQIRQIANDKMRKRTC